jgi:hypothetical protein
MKRHVLAPLALAFSSCVTAYTPVINTTQLQQVDFSKLATKKVGKDCVKYYFGYGPFGNRSVTNAARNAGIRKVELVDYEFEGGYFSQSGCIVVYGD